MLVTNNGFMKWWNDGGKHPLVGDIHSLRTWSHGHWNVVSFPWIAWWMMESWFLYVYQRVGESSYGECVFFWLYMDAYDKEFLG